MEVYLIRHTTPAVDKDVCYGQSETDLADSFDDEAGHLSKFLPASLDVIYTSPLQRCRRLASVLSHDKKVLLDERLREMDFGEWEMKRWNDIDPETLHAWMSDFVNCCVPGGESFTELYDRVNTFIDGLLKQPHKAAAVVTHAGVIRSFLACVLEMPLRNAFKLPVDYASVTKVSLAADRCLHSVVYLNKTVSLGSAKPN